MDAYENINKLINKTIRNARLNISGEINVLTTDITKAIMIDDTLYNLVSESVNKLSEVYPYMDISVSRELHELTIKLFAINTLFVNDDNFLEELQLNISNLIETITATNGLKVRVNFFGQVRTLAKIDKFMLVNNNNDIYCKITESSPQNILSIKTGELIDNYLLKHIF
jgi:hypothetical protein